MNLKIKPRQRLYVKMVYRFGGGISILILIALISYFQFAKIEKTGAAAAVGDYRTATSGNWSTAATWQKCSVAGTPGTWVTATSAPSSSSGIITIQSGHVVTITAAVTVDQVVVASGGEVDLNSGITLTIANGTGNDLDVTGTFKSAGTTSINMGAIVVFESGSAYTHNQNGGTILTATWDPNSTCNITGLTTTYPGGTGQTFGHVTFNSAITANLEMLSSLNCAGNLSIAGTGAKILYLTNSTTGRTITVGGDFDISAGAFTSTNSSGTAAITVSGNMNQTGGTFINVNNSATGTINVTGNFNLSTGTFDLKDGAGAAALYITGNMNITGGTFNERTTSTTSTATVTLTGNFSMNTGTYNMSGIGAIGTLNVSGNFSHTGGTMTESSSGSGSIIFNGSGQQTYTSGGTVSNTINYTVNSGSTLMMGTNLLGNGSSGTFTLSSGATLGIGDPSGIASSGASGNIRVSGTRTYNAGAIYNYNGTSAQSTGNGLPTTLSDFTINNSNGLTLSSNLTLTNSLTFTSGKITTSSNTLSITNTSTSAMTGFSSSSYVIGNLQLSVDPTALPSGFPVYSFPLGTNSNYELAYLTLENTTGVTSVTGTFTNANPINILYALINLVVDGATIGNMLDYGYWTLTPNSAMTGGSIDVKIAEKGFSGSISSNNYYTVLNRANVLSLWQSPGNAQACQYIGGALTANSTAISSFGDFGIGYGIGPPILAFNNHTLISGTDLQVGAVYLFSNVGIGLDAWIQVTDFTNGASISDVDNYTYPNGYDDAWQPFVNVSANDTSSVGWKITFKVAGTSTDTTLPALVFAAIDVDGDGGSTKEYVEAYKASSVSYASGSNLTITNSGSNFTAIPKTTANVANIDTNQTQAMFKVIYNNVNNFQYRTGAIAGSAQVRQASLYFKTFPVTGTTMLPISLLYFTPTLAEGDVDLTWATASEINNDYFTVERSSNGIDFKEILRKAGADNSTKTLSYSSLDANPPKGIIYYRLKQTDYDGKFTYSPVKAVENRAPKSAGNVTIETIGPNPFNNNFNINYNVITQGNVEFQVMNNSGEVVKKEVLSANKGFNSYSFTDNAGLTPGVYFVNLIIDGELVTSKLVKQ